MKKKLLFAAVLIAGLSICSIENAAAQRNNARNDAGVVINGHRWATRNVAAPGTFAATPEDPGMFFQWNRSTGHPATGAVSGWDTSYAQGTEWYAANDPCPRGWRVPTQAEFNSLRAAGTEWTIQNGVPGRTFGTAPNQIFLPAAGWRYNIDGSLQSAGAVGDYWISQPTGQSSAWNLFFNRASHSVGVPSSRAHAFPVRCIAR